MNGSLLDLLQDRNGPLFWLAVAAVAAGSTALVSAALLVGRRWRLRRAAPPAGRALPAPAPAGAAKAAARAAGLRAYRAQAGGPNAGPAVAAASPDRTGPGAGADRGVEPGSGALGAVRLAPLLARLRRAAGELERYAASEEETAAPGPPEMALKPLAGAVEYVHKAGR